MVNVLWRDGAYTYSEIHQHHQTCKISWKSNTPIPVLNVVHQNSNKFIKYHKYAYTFEYTLGEEEGSSILGNEFPTYLLHIAA